MVQNRTPLLSDLLGDLTKSNCMAAAFHGKLFTGSFSREAADRPALNTSNTSNTNKLRSRLDDRAALRLAIGGFGPKMAHTEKTLSSKLEKRS